MTRAPVAPLAVALFLGTVLLFGRAVGFEFVNLDDADYVVENPHVQRGVTLESVRWAFTAVHSANWHPVTWLSHTVDWSLFGADPAGHHATSVLWHGLNAVLAFLALRRLTYATWTSAACAALFAWHPLRVESVAWVSERKDVLSAFFFFVTLWAYASYAAPEVAARRSRPRLAYALALAAFAVGLLCKAMLVTVPFVLLLLDFWPLRRVRGLPGADPTRARTIAALALEKTPFLALAAAASVATYLAQQAGGTFGGVPLGLRLANVAVSVARYVGKVVWPVGLSVMYPYPAGWPAGGVVAALGLLVGVTALALAQARRRPWLATGWLWFLGMLVPVAGFVQVGVQPMADRYTYLPALGLTIALLWTLRDFSQQGETERRVAAGLVAVVLVACTVRTWVQLGVWRSSVTLFQHATSVTSDNYLAYSNLGMALAGERRYADAEASFRRVLEISPPHYSAETMWQNDYMVRYALAVTLVEQQRFDEAGEQLRRVLEKVPDYIDANSHYGAILAMQGRHDEARRRFETALRYDPQRASARYNLAQLDWLEGRRVEALAGWQQALALAPDDARTLCALAGALEAEGRGAEAAPHRERAARLLHPGSCP